LDRIVESWSPVFAEKTGQLGFLANCIFDGATVQLHVFAGRTDEDRCYSGVSNEVRHQQDFTMIRPRPIANIAVRLANRPDMRLPRSRLGLVILG